MFGNYVPDAVAINQVNRQLNLLCISTQVVHSSLLCYGHISQSLDMDTRHICSLVLSFSLSLFLNILHLST